MRTDFDEWDGVSLGQDWGEPEPRHACAYCRTPIDPDDLEWGRILNRAFPGGRSPLRPYHRSTGCAAKDQMGYEG